MKGTNVEVKHYEGYLIDLDGTMYRGSEPIEGAAEFIDTLNDKGIPHLFLTNNSSSTPELVADKLNRMAIAATPDRIFTSSIATAKYISQQKEGARCFVIGEDGLHTALEQEGLILTEKQCDYVVFGIDRAIDYDKYAKAALAIRDGATFISTNGDIAIPTERGLLPGNGALASVLTVSTGVEPIVIGKPERIIMEEALSVLHVEKEKPLMVGDNFHTDIMAGMNAGVDTLLTFTGLTSYDDFLQLETKPTYHVQNLHEWIRRM